MTSVGCWTVGVDKVKTRLQFRVMAVLFPTGMARHSLRACTYSDSVRRSDSDICLATNFRR